MRNRARADKVLHSYVIPKLLLDSAKQAAAAEELSLSQLFHEEALDMIADYKPLMVHPYRRVNRYKKGEIFAKEFEMRSTSMLVDREVWDSLDWRYGGDSIGLPTYIYTAYYYRAKKHGFPVPEKFFDHDYFQEHYMHTKESALEALRRAASKLGRQPTATDWRNIANEVDGPSILTYQQWFGGFQRAKNLAFTEDGQDMKNL